MDRFRIKTFLWTWSGSRPFMDWIRIKAFLWTGSGSMPFYWLHPDQGLFMDRIRIRLLKRSISDLIFVFFFKIKLHSFVPAWYSRLLIFYYFHFIRIKFALFRFFTLLCLWLLAKHNFELFFYIRHKITPRFQSCFMLYYVFLNICKIL